jgi:hypothetical protein
MSVQEAAFGCELEYLEYDSCLFDQTIKLFTSSRACHELNKLTTYESVWNAKPAEWSSSRFWWTLPGTLPFALTNSGFPTHGSHGVSNKITPPLTWSCKFLCSANFLVFFSSLPSAPGLLMFAGVYPCSFSPSNVIAEERQMQVESPKDHQQDLFLRPK